MKIAKPKNVDSEISTASKLLKDRKPITEESPVEFVPTSSTHLNLAASGKGKKGGWARGRIINLVGDGSSGKTWLALELAAFFFYKIKNITSKIFPPVKKVIIKYDNGEEVMDFPIAEVFGQAFADAVFPKEKEEPNSSNIEEFGRRFGRVCEKWKPGDCILYVLDSVDAVGSEEGEKRFDASLKSDKPEDGSYGSGPEKAKYLSQSFFSNIDSKMAGKDITLVLISQIREVFNIVYGKKYKRVGGKSFDFYTHQVCWLYEQEKLTRTIRGEKRAYGIRVLAKLERNKVAKPFREAMLYFVFDYGVDDISGNLAYLYGPKVEKLNWDGESFDRSDLINYIEANKLQEELAERVSEKWLAIEEELRPQRESRY